MKLTKLFNLAALLMAGAAFTACSSDNDIINEQPANPTGQKVYTMVIQASKSDNTTRALRLGADGIDAYWSGDEKIDVVIYDFNIWKLKKIGTATAAPSEGLSTTITATLNDTPSGEVYFYLNGAELDYTGQNGLLTGDNSISEKYDYTRGQLHEADYEVNESTHEIIPNTTLVFSDEAYQAIVKFTLIDKDTDDPINATSLTIHDENGWITQTWDFINNPESPVKGDITITPAGTNVVYAALSGVGDSKLTLTASDGTNTYTYTTPASNVYFAGGSYYEITVKMTKEAAAAKAAAEATAEDKGKLIGTDGNIYADVEAATAAGTTAVAKIIYIGTTGHATYTHGLALALTDEASKMAWGDAMTACNTTKNESIPVTGATWLLASQDQWDYMMGTDGAGSYADLRSASNLQWNYYWSSTEDDSDSSYAWYYSFAYGTWLHVKKGSINYVRACLAF